jgi:hypothetical protein
MDACELTGPVDVRARRLARSRMAPYTSGAQMF